MAGLTDIFGGLFGDSGSPYKDFSREFQKYMQQAQNQMQPWSKAGQGALGDYQSYLNGMKDPQGYVNNIMSGYEMSPGARYNQNQGMRTFQNMGSASGLGGSTALNKQAQQWSQGNTAQDQQQYFNNVNGAHNQYGSGLNSLMGAGQSADTNIAQLLQAMASGMGNAAGGQRMGQLQDRNQLMNGLLGLTAFGGGGGGMGGFGQGQGGQGGGGNDQMMSMLMKMFMGM